MIPIIRIPKPCHEDWNAMTPNEQGRHCDSCCKTVVDFTTWSNEDILRYLTKHSAAKVCGRFTKAQAMGGMPALDISAEAVVQQVARAQMGWLHKVAAIVVLGLSVTFATGCGEEHGQPTTTQHAALIQAASTAAVAAAQQAQMQAQPPMIMGAMIAPPPPGSKDSSGCIKPSIIPTVKIVEPRIVQGEPLPPEMLTGAPIPVPEPPVLPDTPARHPEKLMGKPMPIPDNAGK